jgi:hypothetical protein
LLDLLLDDDDLDEDDFADDLRPLLDLLEPLDLDLDFWVAIWAP